MKYHVYYIEDSCSNLVSFKTLNDRREFVLEFILKHQHDEDNWVHIIFDGEIKYYKDEET